MGVPETLVKRKLVEELDFQGQVDRNLKPHHFYIVKKCDLRMSCKTGEAWTFRVYNVRNCGLVTLVYSCSFCCPRKGNRPHCLKIGSKPWWRGTFCFHSVRLDTQCNTLHLISYKTLTSVFMLWISIQVAPFVHSHRLLDYQIPLQIGQQMFPRTTSARHLLISFLSSNPFSL